MEKDYYKILEMTDEERNLQGKEFQDALSKHWKELSLKYHPDKWVSATEAERKEAEEKFKDISEAHTVLSDEQQRRQYDMQQGGDDDMFSDFGDFWNPFGRQQSRHTRGKDIYADVTLTMEQAYSGVNNFEINANKEESCPHCHGTGSEDGQRHTCPHCHGTGLITQTSHRGNTFFQQSSPCPYCHGTGSLIEKPCKQCGGSGMVRVQTTEKVDLPRGVRDGMNVSFSNRGCDSPDGGPKGSLNVTVHIAPKENFQWIGKDLFYYDEMPFADAMLGCKREYKCIDGKKIKITIPELSRDGAQYRVAQKGMPIMDNFGQFRGLGDMYIVVKHKLPKKLTKEQKDLIKKLGETMN